MILSRQLASVCGRVVGFELRACVQTTDHHCSAAGSESSRRTAPHGPACRPAAPSLCLYFVILSSSYYRISSVISCVCAPPSIRILLPSVAHQVLYPCDSSVTEGVGWDQFVTRTSQYGRDMPYLLLYHRRGQARQGHRGRPAVRTGRGQLRAARRQQAARRRP